MTLETIQAAIIRVLQQVQTDCGFSDGQSITSATVPIGDLTEFDSNVALPAIELVAVALDIVIPADVNIFLSADGKHQVSIEQAGRRVLGLLTKGGAK